MTKLQRKKRETVGVPKSRRGDVKTPPAVESGKRERSEEAPGGEKLRSLGDG